MTEKNYGGANSFGYKGSSANTKNDVSVVSEKSKSRQFEESEDEMDESAVECYLKAGKIVQQVREYVKTIVKKDVFLIDLAEKIENKIEELGGKNAFPVNLSIDEIAAHYTPTIDDKTVASGLLKVDFGVEIEGYIADNAMSFDLTDDKRHSEMINFNNDVLGKTLDLLKVGSPIKTIGNNISFMLEKNGKFRVIKNLSGHSLENDDLHAGLSVLNVKNENEFALENIAIAIEPFLTTGAGEIYEGKSSDIFILQNLDKLPRDRDARKLLEFIGENYRTKPFCKRWLVKSGFTKINFAMSMLVKDGIIHNFPVLVEKEKKPVSQSEHSVLFADKVYVYTRN